VVVPVAYTYLDNLGKRAARWFKGKPEDGEHVGEQRDEKIAEVA
jgi:hypothetical protein